MDMIGSPYGSDNPTASGALGAGELSKYAMMYSSNDSSGTLRYAKVVKVEAYLPLL